MTNEEIRIKVAGALGITGIWPGGHWNGRDTSGKLVPVPNYPESLDACAGFEATLTWKEHLSFRKHLWDIVITLGPEDTWDRQFVSADAKTRCLAYLKTKGLIQ